MQVPTFFFPPNGKQQLYNRWELITYSRQVYHTFLTITRYLEKSYKRNINISLATADVTFQPEKLLLSKLPSLGINPKPNHTIILQQGVVSTQHISRLQRQVDEELLS